jgi:hypothetical protein
MGRWTWAVGHCSKAVNNLLSFAMISTSDYCSIMMIIAKFALEVFFHTDAKCWKLGRDFHVLCDWRSHHWRSSVRASRDRGPSPWPMKFYEEWSIGTSNKIKKHRLDASNDVAHCSLKLLYAWTLGPSEKEYEVHVRPREDRQLAGRPHRGGGVDGSCTLRLSLVVHTS